jgi:hypothetical protein
MMFAERTAAWASLVHGLALPSAIAPGDAWFLPNLFVYAASLLAVLGVIAAAPPSRPVLRLEVAWLFFRQSTRTSRSRERSRGRL